GPRVVPGPRTPRRSTDGSHEGLQEAGQAAPTGPRCGNWRGRRAARRPEDRLVRFWDTSSVVPVLVRERTSAQVAARYDEDASIVVCWTTSVEAWAAVSRRRREGALKSPDVRAARERLRWLREDWAEVDDVEALRARAIRLVEVHPLRSADGLQLAAAL